MLITKTEAFRILELSEDASVYEIKSAYKRLALLTHPDKNMNKEEATQKFQEILLAYKTLTVENAEERKLFEDITPGMMSQLFEMFLNRYMFRSYFGFSSDEEVSYDPDTDEMYSDTDSELNCEPYFCPKHAHLRNCGSPLIGGNKQERFTITYNQVSEEIADKNARELIESEEQEKRKHEKKRQRRKRQKVKKKEKEPVHTINGKSYSNSESQDNDDDDLFDINPAFVQKLKLKVEAENVKRSNSLRENGHYTGLEADLLNSFSDDWKTVSKEKKPKVKTESVNNTKKKKFSVLQKALKETTNFNHIFTQPSQPSNGGTTNGATTSLQVHNTDITNDMTINNLYNNWGDSGDTNNNCLSQDSNSFLSRSSGGCNLQASHTSSLLTSGYFSDKLTESCSELTISRYQQPFEFLVSDEAKREARQWAKDGNKLATGFKHWEGALNCFTNALNLDPTECRYYGNRAFCLENLGRVTESLRDAETSIRLDPTYIKGHFRKGRALMVLNRFEDAASSFECVTSLDPNDQEAKEQLLEARKQHLIFMGFSSTNAEKAILNSRSLGDAINFLLGPTRLTQQQHVFAPSVTQQQLVFSPSPSVTQQSPAPKTFSDVSKMNISMPKTVAPPPVIAPAAVSKEDVKPAKLPADAHMDPDNPMRSTALWVGNVMPTVNEKKLSELFSVYGKVLSVKLMKQTCCAFVNMGTPEDAGKAVGGFLDTPALVCGRELIVRFSQAAKKTR